MESFFVRYRNLVVLLAVLVAQIAGLAVQVRRSDSGRASLDARDSSGVRLIRYWAESLVFPPERLFRATGGGISGIWSGYIDLRHVRQQNQQLQQTLDRLRLEEAELMEDAQQGQRLQQLLGFREHYVYSTVAAQVYGSSGSDLSKVFYIDKGADDGLKRDMPVISPDGIVGKVREVYPHSAQVLAVNDQTSGAGVILEATRVRGVLKGNAAGQLEIVGLMADERIKPGEKVLTAGGDMIFPRGLPVGTVEKVVPDPERDSFIDVILRPAAHLERLDEVLVITSTDTAMPAEDQKDIATSEKLKGAQAAALAQAAAAAAQAQEKMKASEIMAEHLPTANEPSQYDGLPASPASNGAAPPAPAAGQGTPATPPVPKLLPVRHPDQFSPQSEGDSTGTGADAAPQTAPQADHAPANRKRSGTGRVQ